MVSNYDEIIRRAEAHIAHAKELNSHMLLDAVKDTLSVLNDNRNLRDELSYVLDKIKVRLERHEARLTLLEEKPK